MRRHTYPARAVLIALLGVAALAIGVSSEPGPLQAQALDRPQRGASPAPTSNPVVRSASPATPVVKIGGGAATIVLSGDNLGKVLKVVLVDGNGRGVLLPGVATRPDGKSMKLAVEPGRSIAAGEYYIQLQYGASPLQKGKQEPTTKLTVPAQVLRVRVVAMQPRVTGFAPATPRKGSDILLRTVVAEVPGVEVLSVTRQRDAQDCRFKAWTGQIAGSPPPELAGTRWQGASLLELSMNRGEWSAAGTRCRMRFFIRTRSASAEEFYSVAEGWLTLTDAPRRTFTLGETWAIRDVVRFTLQRLVARGVCEGSSVGPHGAHPVGVLNVGGDLALRVRSGPIGTQCVWQVEVPRLQPDWSVRFEFEPQPVGDKCAVWRNSTTAPPVQLEFPAGIGLGGVTVTRAGVVGEAALGCGPTLSNDHQVTARLERVVVTSPRDWTGAYQNATWRGAFQ